MARGRAATRSQMRTTASAPSCADATNLFVCAAESATTGAVWPIRCFCAPLPSSCTTTKEETA